MTRSGAFACAALVLASGYAVAQTGVGNTAADDKLASYLATAEELRSARKCRDALQHYGSAEQALGARESALAWQVHFGMASCQLSLGHHDQAAERIALLRALSGNDAARLTRTARFEAALLHRGGRLQEAEQASLRAVEAAATSDDPVLEIEAYSMLATVYSLQGRNHEATAIDERLLAMERELDRGPKALGLALNELAIDYRRFGRFDEGIALLREALALYRVAADADGQAMVLYNMAQVHTDNGDVDNAFAMYREALTYSEQVGNSYGLGLLHTALGEMLVKAGNATEGRKHLQRSLESNREAKQAYGELLALMGLGSLERLEHRYAASRDLLETAVVLADERGFGGMQAFARIELALTLAEDGDTRRAFELLDQAQALGEEQDDFKVLFELAAARGKVLEQAGLGPQAADQYLLAVGMLESWRGRMLFGDLLVSVPERYWHVYEGAIRVLAASGRDHEAFVVSERARARMLLDTLANRNLGDEASSEGRRLRARLMSVGTALASASDVQKPALESEAATLSAALQVLEEQSRSDNAALAAITFPMQLDVSYLRKTALPSGSALLTYFWGEEQVYAWRIDAQGVRLVTLGPAAELTQQAEFLRAAIDARSASIDWRPAAARAYQDLLAPLLDDPADMLFVVADGPLLSLPLEVFLAEPAGEPLGASTAIAYVPSATVLAALAGRAQRAAPAASVLALGYSPARGDAYAPLPLATKEAGAVYSLYREDGARLLADQGATLAAWMAAEPQNYRILHFAAHAIIDEKRPEKSHLVFAESRLDLETIRQLRFNAELVTLSACETAVGRHWRGEGMVSLAYAFLASGSQALLASTWRVDDRYTADFMREFYVRLESGDPALNSLVQVRRDWIRKSGAYAHPGNWGGFVMLGWPQPSGATGAGAAPVAVFPAD